MNTLSRDEARQLIDLRATPCLTFTMPTLRAGTDQQQNPIRFGNLIKQAEEKLRSRRYRDNQIAEILEPARRVLGDDLFWQKPEEGLAVLLAPGFSRVLRLPIPLEERIAIGQEFVMRPLLPLLVNDGPFYILALSQGRARLLRGSRHSVEEIRVDSIPKSLSDALKYDQQEKQTQWHATTGSTVGGGGHQAYYHGHGVGRDDQKTDILRYFQQIDAGMAELLKGDSATPVVLAGVDYLIPIYREANRVANVLPEAILGNPDGLKAEELQARAWSIVHQHFRKGQERAEARLRGLLARDEALASRDLATIALCAFQGRVDALFVATDRCVPGRFDPATGMVERPIPGAQAVTAGGDAEDLLEYVAKQTFRTGGAVYAVRSDEVPEAQEAAAVFRY
ncbi:MAG: hypothetical protein ACE15D_05970 [Candidatus Eisenbacteria bacterium]|nr:hypothetical protein [Candidatus Eisenbacteria bacterium]